MRFLAAALATGLLFATVSVTADEHDAPATVRFVLFGDQGAGNQGQLDVAAAVASVCAARGCDFVVTLGDNIYESGVTSPYDPQFESKFETPYAGFNIPFYMVIGNHDDGEVILGEEQGLGSDASRGDQQVAYHYRSDRTSEKWQMPARYYTFTAGDGLVQFFAIDTNNMMWWGEPLRHHDPFLLEQFAWFRTEAAASTATWKFTFAHHPYATNGQHGDAGEMEGVPTLGLHIKRFFEEEACDDIDFHFAGHDHDLQWLKPVASCPGVEFIVSGAGSKTRSLGDPDRHEAWWQQTGPTLGFFWVEVTGNTFKGVAYTVSGGSPTVAFERIVTK